MAMMDFRALMSGSPLTRACFCLAKLAEVRVLTATAH